MRISQVLSRQESTRFMLYDRPGRKRVAVINTGGILLSYGGASPFMRNLDPFLKQAYELSYFSLPNSLQSVRWVPHRLLFLLYLFFQYRKLKQFDFIISHVPEGSFVVSFLRVPYLHIFHGNANPMTLSRFWFGKYFAGIFQRMERRIVRTAKLMYTVGKPRVDIPKILNPIFHSIRIKPIEQRSGFIFAGRLEKMKQVDRIIRAYSQLSPEIIHKHPLYIAGSGSQYASLRSLADHLNMRQHVIFQGNLDNATLLEECSRRSVLLMASSQEGFPMAIAEAFSLGVPVVATDVGDISTFLVNQYNGILLPVSFRDEEYIAAIGSILKTYVDYSANALASATVFRADKVAESIIRDINQVIDPSN